MTRRVIIESMIKPWVVSGVELVKVPDKTTVTIYGE